MLTMWYVNSYEVLLKNTGINSFMLTMWYVNTGIRENTFLEKRFILTMWYVNNIDLYLLEYTFY